MAVSSGDYQLYWSDLSFGVPLQDNPGQYVFATRVELPFSLRRVRTFQDLVQAIPGGEQSAMQIVVAAIALLAGNLIAMRRWLSLLGFAVTGVVAAIFYLPRTAVVSFAALVAMTIVDAVSTDIFVSPDWFITVALVVTVTIFIVGLLLYMVREDPRSHVLWRQKFDSSVVIYNHCSMDIKLLSFDSTDVVRLIPHGGVLGGALVERGAAHKLGDAPPYFVRVYAPFEYELGSFVVEGGVYSFRATVPPFKMMPSNSPRFTNVTTDCVQICICRANDWTRSLWLPFSCVWARLSGSIYVVKPDENLALNGEPCVIRVFGGSGFSSWHEHSCCMVEANESIDYMGSVRWTAPRPKSETSSMKSAASSSSSLSGLK